MHKKILKNNVDKNFNKNIFYFQNNSKIYRNIYYRKIN